MENFQILLVFLILLGFPLSLDYVHASEIYCSISSCGTEFGPEVQFPFRLTSQPDRCGYPGFLLTCRGYQMMLHRPYSYLRFNVESIHYVNQQLTLTVADPQPDPFVKNLYLSRSPFTYYSSENSLYTLLNCSISYNDIKAISCRGYTGGHLYILPSDTELINVPKSCNPLKRIDSSDVILEWSIPGSNNCSWDTERCQFKNSHSNETICGLYEPLNSQPLYDLPYDHKGSSKNKVIAELTVGAFLVVAAAIAAIKFYQSWQSKRKKEAEHRLKVENFLKDYKSLKPTRYTYAEIKKITNHFKSPLGQGGYGTVFKGNLPNGILVAVKILKRSIEESDDFMNEVSTIGRIHHVNVVRLLGFCADGYERALIYEFMPNESLEKFIFLEGSKRPFLGWEKLQSIAIGIARGIEYLHQGCDQRILHFDIKPHNVLLDQNFNPKITDFGLAKLCSKERSIVSMSVAKGTMGYIAPEVISRSFGNVSYKSDVYSFGVLLLEMVRGRKNDKNANAEEFGQAYFPEWLYDQLNQREEKELEIIEEENPLVAKRFGGEIELEIVGDEDALIAKKLIIIALWCMQWYPVNRPSIQRVVQMLEGSIESLVMPPNPFGSASKNDIPSSLCKKSQRAELTVIVE